MIIIGEGWQQQFTFVNVSYYAPEPTVGTLYFYTKDGQPWKLPLKNRGAVDHVDINLRSGQMLTLDTEVLWTSQQLGWAQLKLSAKITEWGIYHAYTVYRKQTEGRADLMTSVPFVDDLEDDWIIPFDNSDGKYPGIGVVNTSSYATTTFLFQVFDETGNSVRTFTKTVQPRCLLWFSLIQEYPELTSKRGQIKVNGGLWSSAALTLQFASNGAFTALPLVHSFGM